MTEQTIADATLRHLLFSETLTGKRQRKGSGAQHAAPLHSFHPLPLWNRDFFQHLLDDLVGRDIFRLGAHGADQPVAQRVRSNALDICR